MYNLVYGLRTPYTTATIFYRWINLILGVAIVMLVLLLGFNALKSDIGRRQSGADNLFNNSNDPMDNSLSPLSCNMDGMGMMLFPMLPGEGSALFPSTINGNKIKPAVYDTTVYTLQDVVDRRPQLIWMIYPDVQGDIKTKDSDKAIVINILVDYDGRVLEANFDNGPVLDNETIQIILKSASGSMFKPALVNDLPVKCWVQISLELSPKV